MTFSSSGDGTSSRVEKKLRRLIVLRIRRRSRILRKQDFEIQEMRSANERFLSRMTPRLRAESIMNNNFIDGI